MPPKLGILAGGGQLPAKIIDACRDSGRDFFVIAFKGQADPDAFDDVPHAWLRLGAAGEMIDRLRAEGCRELVMAGRVRRPSLAALRPDKWTAWFFARSGSRALGDAGLLKTLIETLEENEGFRIVGVESLLPDLLAAEGVYGKVTPDRQAEDDVELGIKAALEIGVRDEGQGAVVQQGRVVAVENADGTNALLKRAGKLRSDGPGGVLVKVKKPDQEHRVDLPTIGVTTVAGAKAAGLRGIAVEAGGALIVERDALIEAADAAGLFVIGVDVGDRPPPAKEAAARPSRELDPNTLIFIVAGEPSGDLLGGRLMAALKRDSDPGITFTGVGGIRMEEQGLKSLFPMTDLSVMGVAEVLPRLPRILARIRETTAAVERLRPAALITIDSPDFNFRVAKRLKGKGIPIIHYVAPSVWAWRPGRARKVAGFLDHLMTLLPFEPPYFEAEGLASSFVGHPVVEGGADKGDGPEFRRRHGMSQDDKVVVVLPGSRMGEVSRLHKVFGEALFLLKKKHPDLRAVVPAADAVSRIVRRMTGHWPVPALVVDGEREKFDAFAAADVALAASGTVALELAMAGTPAVIAYRINPISAWLGKRLIKVRFVHLVNLILDREAIPEFLQDACRPDFLAAALEDLMMDAGRREGQISAYGEALSQLGHNGPSPASMAAAVVIDTLARAGNDTSR